MSRPGRPGDPPGNRHWYLRSYLRAVSAMLVGVVLTFVLLRDGVNRYVDYLRHHVHTCGGVPCTEELIARRLSAFLVFDLGDPVAHQFADFATATLTYLPVAGFLVGGLAVALALRHRERTQSTAY